MAKITYNKVTESLIEAFKTVVGNEFVTTRSEILENYSHDHTEDLKFSPEVVIFPKNAQQISKIVKLCNENLIPIVAAGARTGLSGGVLPIFGGVSISTKRMNAITIDKRNLQAIVEPGVITQVLHETAEKENLFYPPDPSSKGSCFIGGNIAENAGGLRAVKYGITKDYVLNLELVLANGEIIQTGANVLKNSTGYNLTQLMVGSEGTLGIITKAWLKLIPKPQFFNTLLVPFNDPFKACDAVSAILRAGITPAALEFLEKDAIDFGKEYLGIDVFPNADYSAHLLIQLDGNYPEIMMNEAERIFEVVEKYDCGEILFAENAAQQDKLWNLRRSIGEAVKSRSVYKEEDTVVPRAELAKLLAFVKKTGEQYGFKSVCYGHAGDGNLHVNILKNDMSDEKWNNELPEAIRKIFEFTVSLGGTLSGEHGIGWVQKQYMDIPFSEVSLNLMKDIKKLFDPNNIMNPGKIFD